MNVRHTASVPAGMIVDVTILTGMAFHLMPVPRRKSKTIMRKRAGGCQPGGARIPWRWCGCDAGRYGRCGRLRRRSGRGGGCQ
jgi:hypothetical protein